MNPITDNTMVGIVERSTKPIVIKFEARWCQPCKAMTPILQDVEKELGNKVSFYVANVEHCPMTTQRYKINQIPALLAIDKGVVTAVRSGAASKSEVLQWINSALPGLKA